MANRAVEIDPDDSTAMPCARSCSTGWPARDLVGDELILTWCRPSRLPCAPFSSTAAIALALAYYAEILLDQMKWQQAEQNISAALEQMIH
jgi:hypothetical protein